MNRNLKPNPDVISQHWPQGKPFALRSRQFSDCLMTVEDTEWFGVIFELPDVLVVEYQVISSSLLKGL